jgi:hypothetical protein
MVSWRWVAISLALAAVQVPLPLSIPLYPHLINLFLSPLCSE